jgi:hypothetical protein
MKFTKQEYADLHLLYGETHGNSRPARRPYGERFPEVGSPSVPLYYWGQNTLVVILLSLQNKSM